VDRTADLVVRVLEKQYSTVIIDSESIGLSAEDAAEIALRSSEDTRVIIAGKVSARTRALVVEKPLDLEKIKHLVRDLCITGSQK